MSDDQQDDRVRDGGNGDVTNPVPDLDTGELLLFVGFTPEEAATLLTAGLTTRQLAWGMIHRLALRANLMEEYLRRKAEVNRSGIIVPGRLN